VSLSGLFRRSRKDAELSLELESHLQHEIDDNLARGMSPEEARRQALVKLGNPLVIRDKVWEANRIVWLEDTWRNARYAGPHTGSNPELHLHRRTGHGAGNRRQHCNLQLP
jgi:hypothetical protein